MSLLGRVLPVRDMLSASSTRHAFLEFTTRCNLNCVYCASNLPHYLRTDMDLTHFSQLADTLRRRKVARAAVHGHGETTIVDGWYRYCRILLDRGMDLSIITNMAKPLNDDEVGVLARFERIEVSCDTANPELFRRLRRGATLPTLSANCRKVAAAAATERIVRPELGISAVVSDRTVFELPDLVSFGLELGVRRFAFSDLVEYPHVKNADRVRPVSSLGAEEVRRIPSVIQQVLKMAGKRGAVCEFQPSLLDIRERERGVVREERSETVSAQAPNPASRRPSPGQTRDCLDPWDVVFFAADGSIRPCCGTIDPVGNTAEDSACDSVWNDEPFRAYRRGLLTGDLKPACRNCSMRGWTTVENLCDKVRLLKFLRGMQDALPKRWRAKGG